MPSCHRRGATFNEPRLAVLREIDSGLGALMGDIEGPLLVGTPKDRFTAAGREPHKPSMTSSLAKQLARQGLPPGSSMHVDKFME